MKVQINGHSECTPLLESKRLSSNGSYQYEKPTTPEGWEGEVETRQPKKETHLTDLQTMMHLLKASIGIGILGLPKALMNSGILVGPLLLFVLAVATIHCMQLLIKTSHHLRDETGRPSLTYGEVADECLRRVYPEYMGYGSAIVNIMICINQFGACTAYVLFIAENLHDSMADLHAVTIPEKMYIAITLPFLLVFCMVTDLRSLYWMSWIANVLMVIVFVSIFEYLYGHSQDPSELDKFSSWGDLPLAFGTATYAFEAICIILPLENKAKNPGHYPRIINIGMGLVMFLYFNMAVFGYMTFQDECRGSVTLNLPNTEYFSSLKLMVSVAIFLSYFIQVYVLFHIIEPVLCRRVPERYHTLSIIVLRVTTVCVICGLAAAIPHLNDIIALCGSTGGAFLAFVLPTTFHWIVFSQEIGPIVKIKNIFIIILGVLGSITCTYASLRNIIKDK